MSATLQSQTKLKMGCIMLLGTSRGSNIYIIGKFIATPQGIPSNIVGIFSPEIWPQGGLHGSWGFSGDWVYTYSGRGCGTCIPLGVPWFFYVSSFGLPQGLPLVAFGYRLELLKVGQNFVTINTLGNYFDFILGIKKNPPVIS